MSWWLQRLVDHPFFATVEFTLMFVCFVIGVRMVVWYYEVTERLERIEKMLKAKS